MPRRDDRAAPRGSARGRPFAAVLLAVHLVVCLFGGALLGERSARAAGQRAIVVSASTGFDGPTLVSAADPRLELTRPRGDRGERGFGPVPAVVLVGGAPVVAPAELIGSVDWRSASRERRSLPSVVHGARGPPTAR